MDHHNLGREAKQDAMVGIASAQCQLPELQDSCLSHSWAPAGQQNALKPTLVPNQIKGEGYVFTQGTMIKNGIASLQAWSGTVHCVISRFYHLSSIACVDQTDHLQPGIVQELFYSTLCCL